MTDAQCVALMVSQRIGDRHYLDGQMAPELTRAEHILKAAQKAVPDCTCASGLQGIKPFAEFSREYTLPPDAP